MAITLLVKAKGWLTIVLGAVFLMLPSQLMSVMGAEITDAGIVMAQLFGLLAIAVAWGMVLPRHSVAAGSEALAVVLADTAAMALLISATNKAVFSGLGYALAAVYAVSALLYLYLFFYHRGALAPADNLSDSV